MESLTVQSQPSKAELEVRLQLPGVCNITGHLRVVFRPECIVQVDFSILRFEALGDDIREIDLQLPMDAIANALATVSSQPVTVQEVTTSEVQAVEHSSIPALPAQVKAETLDIKEFYSLLASMSSHTEESSHVVDELKGSEIFFGKAVQRVKHNDAQGVTTTRNNEVQVIELLTVQSQPCKAELEVRLQLPGVCNITGHLRVVFRPEYIVQIDFSILRFEALGDDIREINLQLPMDAIANALATVSSQPITVQEVTTSEVQAVERSSIPALPAQAKAETLDIKEFYSLLASMSSHAEESTHDVDELKGSAKLCELEKAPSEQELKDIMAIEPAEGLKPLDNANNLENALKTETTVTAQRDLQLKEPVNAVPIFPTEGIELQHAIILGLPEVSVVKQPTAAQVSEITESPPSAQEVQASRSINTVCQAIQTEDVHKTSNILEEVVAREIREIRETVDTTVGGIRDVPLERPTTRRRRKRSHADDSDDNQLSSKGYEAEERVAKDNDDEMQEPHLVTNAAQRYPSDVHQALLTQTVHLLERGVVLLSDEGSFIAVANPSSASRIGDALTGHNFAQIFHRYDNDVLPDLKQKVIERAALVAREHQDRVLEGMVERPIFTLSEIRHYDCNGDYIMEDVSSPNTHVFPFTGIQPTPVHQGFVNPFLTGMTPQGLLTADMHTPFQLLQHDQYTVNDIEMIDVDELYMDVDESIEDMFMECDDQEDCPYCSQISLSLFASLPTKYAIRRRAIYSLLDKRPLNPEIPSWKINQGTKKSWFAYNTYNFRPEFDQPLGGLSPKDRVIYSLLDERPLNPELAPYLARQGKSKSWFAYNTFSFREEDLVPVGSNCDCMQTTTAVEPWSKPDQVTKPIFPSTSEENIATKSPSNTFSFRPEDNSSQQASIFGESKQESVFSFGMAEQPVPPTEPETISTGISWKDFSFREEDDSQTEAENPGENDQQSPDLLREPETPTLTTISSGISWKDFSFREEDDSQTEAENPGENDQQSPDLRREPETPTLTTISSGISWKDFSFREEDDSQTEAENSGENDQQSPDLPREPETPTLTTISSGISWKDFSFREEDDPLFQAETKQQATDPSLETEKQSVNKETLAFPCEQEEEPTFPVSEDSDATSSEAESDDDLFDLNDENEEQTIKEIIAAVKSKLDERRMYHYPQEDVAQVSSKGESVKVDETASKVEPTNKQGVADGQTNLETKDNEDKALKDGKGQSQETNQVSKDPPQAAKQEKSNSLESREPASKLTISHSKSINKRSEPYPNQAVSGLAAVMRRCVKMVERDRLKTLQVLTQVTLEDKDADSSEPVPALPADNAQQRKDVSLKSLTGNTKTKSSSNSDLAITIGPSDAEKRKVVSLKSSTGNKQTRSSSKPDLAITIGAPDSEERQVVSSRTLAQDKKAELPTAPSVQSDVNSSKKKISLKSLTQTKKKETDVKGSEMDRLTSRHQSKDADVLGKPTPTTSAVSAAQRLESSTKQDSVKTVEYSNTADPPKETIPYKPLPAVKVEEGRMVSLKSLTRRSKSNPMNKAASASPPASTATGSRTEKVSFKITDAKGKELESNKISSSKTKVSDAKNPHVVAMDKVSVASDVAETGIARKVTFGLNQERPKEDVLIKLSSSPSLEQKPIMVSTRKESHATTAAESSSVKAVDIKTTSMKEDEVIKSFIEHAPCEQNLKKESHASSVAGASSAKTVDLRSKLSKKDELKMTSTERASCQKNTQVVSTKKASNASSGPENGSVKQVTSKKENLTKPSPSTKPVSCERTVNVVPLKSVSQSDKDGPLSKPSWSTSPSSCVEQENQLMSFKSVTEKKWAVPVRKSSGSINTSVPLMEACAVTTTADVKIDGSAKEDDQPHPVVSQPSSSGK